MILKHFNSISCEIIYNWYFFSKATAHSKVFIRNVYIRSTKAKQIMLAYITRSLGCKYPSKRSKLVLLCCMG